MDKYATDIVTILTAIVGVAILAVLVGKSSQTAAVITAAAKGFASDLTAAEGPVSGSGVGSLSLT
jgi:hypothetical protein